MDSYRIVILGSGNVAEHLCRAFVQNKIPIHQIYSRNKTTGSQLASAAGAGFTDDLKEICLNGDIFIFAVSDSAVQSILSSGSWNNKVLIHTAGSIPAQVFKPFTAHYGVIYPLQTLSVYRQIDSRAIPYFIEYSDDLSERLIKKLMTSLSSEIRIADSEKRRMLHICAVYLSNFTNHMCSIAKQLAAERNISFDVFKPLMLETFAKIQGSDPLTGQTGPARRNDVAVMDSHINDLKDHPDWQKIYTFVSRSIVEMYKEKGV